MQAPDDRIRPWIRAVLAVLAIPQAVTGAWAVAAPEHWFARFPGFDPRLVAAEPPYNAHLATDAGAGFLATGVALGVAAWWATRGPAHLAAVAYLAFALPHFAYHLLNPAPALTSAENAVNVVGLAVGPALAALVLGATRGHRPDAARPSPVEAGLKS